MRLKQLAIASLAVLVFIGNATAATSRFQAGDIRLGQKVLITSQFDPDSTGVASYYVDGTEGEVEFTCDLKSVSANEPISATLRGGKNFDSTLYAGVTLHEGVNGPFIWKLSPQGKDVGNIKVGLGGRKASAYLQCKGSFVSE